MLVKAIQASFPVIRVARFAYRDLANSHLIFAMAVSLSAERLFLLEGQALVVKEITHKVK